jgi:hypothetical protein
VVEGSKPNTVGACHASDGFGFYWSARLGFAEILLR